jgi:hypothetical protein
MHRNLSLHAAHTFPLRQLRSYIGAVAVDGAEAKLPSAVQGEVLVVDAWDTNLSCAVGNVNVPGSA